jgi:hypothetical protein
VRTHPLHNALRLIPLLALLAAGCTDQAKKPEYVARVGTAELSSEDLRYLADSTRGIGRTSHDAVNDWIVNELLYQEAARRGLTSGDTYRRQVDEAKKRLAISALLDRELFADDDTALVNNAAVDAAYHAAPGDYVLRDNVALASYVLFSSREAANTFRAAVLRGMNWNDAVREARSDPQTAPLVLQTAAHQYFTQATLFPAELWRLTQSLGREEVSFALRAGAGYYVVKCHEVRRKGEAPALEYVRDDIRQRLLIEERRSRYERLVADLRNRYGIDVRLDHMDSTRGRVE